MHRQKKCIMSLAEHREHYNSKNPISQYLIKNFTNSILNLCNQVRPANFIEVGCGDGYISLQLAKRGYSGEAFDINPILITQAVEELAELSLNDRLKFYTDDLYLIDFSKINRDILLCCEVLEHLENPEDVIKNFSKTNCQYFIFSVPAEPLWSVLNLVRFKYIYSFGNTPGHINRWNYFTFQRFIGTYFDIIKMRFPIPWIILLCKRKGIQLQNIK